MDWFSATLGSWRSTWAAERSSHEGNTALGNNSNGRQVMRRIRYLSYVNGFGRVVK